MLYIIIDGRVISATRLWVNIGCLQFFTKGGVFFSLIFSATLFM